MSSNKGLLIKISGKLGIFRKPDTNKGIIFTYNNPPKTALLGIFGAILGYKGYIDSVDKKELPEFYERLKHLKVAIKPNGASYGRFNRSYNVFTDTTGNSSKESTATLLVKEEMLINPSWTIIVLDDGSLEYKDLKEKLLSKKATFIPYIGKNDFQANIEAKEVELDEVEADDEGYFFIDSIFYKELYQKLDREINDIEPISFIFEESLPIGYIEDESVKHLCHYDFKFFVTTNYLLKNIEEIKKYTIRSYNGKNYFFF
jgi:CRISPR-associated protein Cas5h